MEQKSFSTSVDLKLNEFEHAGRVLQSYGWNPSSSSDAAFIIFSRGDVTIDGISYHAVLSHCKYGNPRIELSSDDPNAQKIFDNQKLPYISRGKIRYLGKLDFPGEDQFTGPDKTKSTDGYKETLKKLMGLDWPGPDEIGMGAMMPETPVQDLPSFNLDGHDISVRAYSGWNEIMLYSPDRPEDVIKSLVERGFKIKQK